MWNLFKTLLKITISVQMPEMKLFCLLSVVLPFVQCSTPSGCCIKVHEFVRKTRQENGLQYHLIIIHARITAAHKIHFLLNIFFSSFSISNSKIQLVIPPALSKKKINCIIQKCNPKFHTVNSCTKREKKGITTTSTLEKYSKHSLMEYNIQTFTFLFRLKLKCTLI